VALYKIIKKLYKNNTIKKKNKTGHPPFWPRGGSVTTPMAGKKKIIMGFGP
jgi:hypothetical protein